MGGTTSQTEAPAVVDENQAEQYNATLLADPISPKLSVKPLVEDSQSDEIALAADEGSEQVIDADQPSTPDSSCHIAETSLPNPVSPKLSDKAEAENSVPIVREPEQEGIAEPPSSVDAVEASDPVVPEYHLEDIVAQPSSSITAEEVEIMETGSDGSQQEQKTVQPEATWEASQLPAVSSLARQVVLQTTSNQHDCDLDSQVKKSKAFLQYWGFRSVNCPRKGFCGVPGYALHLAVDQNDLDSVKALVASGADVAQTNSAGRTACELAQWLNQQGSHDEIIVAFRSWP